LRIFSRSIPYEPKRSRVPVSSCRKYPGGRPQGGGQRPRWTGFFSVNVVSVMGVSQLGAFLVEDCGAMGKVDSRVNNPCGLGGVKAGLTAS